MSTDWHFVCMDHDPPIISDEEFTQHTDDYAFKRGVQLAKTREQWLAAEKTLVDLGGDFLQGDYFESNAYRFLRRHPKCKLALENEYGQEREL